MFDTADSTIHAATTVFPKPVAIFIIPALFLRKQSRAASTASFWYGRISNFILAFYANVSSYYGRTKGI